MNITCSYNFIDVDIERSEIYEKPKYQCKEKKERENAKMLAVVAFGKQMCWLPSSET